MTEQVKRKATRKIKKFDFSDENATVSLVGPLVGGPAVGYTTLLTKSNKQVSEEFIKKASQVTVTLEITEYLKRFFGLWYEDAEILARTLGFTTAEMDDQEEDKAEGETGNWYEDYINARVGSVSVMKQLYHSQDINKSLVDVSEEDYLQLLKDQEMLEKVFVDIEKAKNSSAKAGDTSTNVDVEKVEGNTSVVKNKNKGNKSMSKDTQVIEKSVEVVEKAEFEAIQKSLSDTQVELQKALDTLKQFEAEKKEAIAKSRKEQLDKACGKHSEVIFKACGELQEEMFVEVVKAFADMQEQISKSDAFKELGADVEDESVGNESSLAKVIKAKYSNKQ